MATPKAQIIPVTPFQQNCCLIWDDATGEGAVVDPGGDVALIREAIAAQPGVTVRQILITHGHIDHAGGAAELAAALGGIPVVGPAEEDRFLLDALPVTGLKYGMTGARAVTPDRWLRHGDEVTVGGIHFAVKHCPGHSPGHVIFFAEEFRFALMGDVLFQGSIGRTDLPGGDHETLLRSIREEVLPLGDDVSFLCGHGNPSTIGQERLSNPFLREPV